MKQNIEKKIAEKKDKVSSNFKEVDHNQLKLIDDVFITFIYYSLYMGVPHRFLGLVRESVPCFSGGLFVRCLVG